MQDINQLPWNIYQKIIFRFTFLFFSFFIIPFPFSFIPVVNKVETWYLKMWTPAYDWIGRLFFEVGETLEYTPSGSGDRLYDYLQNFSYLFVSIILTIIWTLVDRKRSSYVKLYNWFVMIVAYYLGGILLIYGITKTFYLQFTTPSLSSLLHTYGQSSPMRLMWNFMGASELYTKFSGYCEVFAGLLLFYSRTRTLGGLVTIVLMFNVFMLNLSYDIAVKLYSFLLLIMAGYIIARDLKRIIFLFVLDRPTESSFNFSINIYGKWKYLLYTIQVAFVILQFYRNIDRNIGYQELYFGKNSYPPLYGIYSVTNFSKNGKELPPLMTDSTYWKYLVLDQRGSLIKKATGQTKFFAYETDTIKNTLTFKLRNDSLTSYRFDYREIENKLLLNGFFEADSLELALEYHDKNEFLLINRGFHWINELPNNLYNYKGYHP